MGRLACKVCAFVNSQGMPANVNGVGPMLSEPVNAEVVGWLDFKSKANYVFLSFESLNSDLHCIVALETSEHQVRGIELIFECDDTRRHLNQSYKRDRGW